jgi:hypothetical protein
MAEGTIEMRTALYVICVYLSRLVWVLEDGGAKNQMYFYWFVNGIVAVMLILDWKRKETK